MRYFTCVRSLGIALAALASAVGCRYRPTQVTLSLDSNVDHARPMALTIVTLQGARAVAELRAAQGSVTRLSNADRPLFPGSLALVPPRDGPRASQQSLLATLDVQEQPGRPALRIERVQRLSLLEQVPLQASIFFNAECATLAVGCTQVPAAACTVSQRCIEQGLTCGDDGSCVALELPTTTNPPASLSDAADTSSLVDATTRLDGSDAALDATAPSDAAMDSAPDVLDATDEPSADAAIDAPSCPANTHRVANACVDHGGVRPVSPISLADTSSRSPTLRFVLPSGADGALVELCRDRACTRVIETLRVTANTARPSAPLPASTAVFWRARARVGTTDDSTAHVGPTWLFHTPDHDNTGAIDTSTNPHLDINGDGFDDAIIGAERASPSSRLTAGSVRVHFGSTTGIASMASLVLEGARAGDAFGSSVACAGDVNGDGFADVIIGARGADPSGRIDAGTASVFLGSAAGLSSTSALVIEGVEFGDGFGGAVATAGDVNRDGYSDVIVGARGAAFGGSATIFHGSAAGVTARAARVLTNMGERFGASVASAGDVNGDGYSDVIIGAPLADPTGIVNAGSAFVFHGSDRGIGALPSHTLDGSATDDQLGTVVASAGDTDGDGYSDVVVGAPSASRGGRSTCGAAIVYRGSPSGVSTIFFSQLEGTLAQDNFGFSVAGGGDLNGDGYSDVVVGALRLGESEVAIFHGRPSGITAPRARTLNSMGALFGAALASSSDVNGDGFADLVVGAPGADPSGRTNAGVARIFHGSSVGIALSSDTVLEGSAVDDGFGQTLARGFGRRRDERTHHPRASPLPSRCDLRASSR